MLEVVGDYDDLAHRLLFFSVSKLFYNVYALYLLKSRRNLKKPIPKSFKFFVSQSSPSGCHFETLVSLTQIRRVRVPFQSSLT